MVSLDALQGIPCSGGGTAGSVRIEYGAAGAVSLTCAQSPVSPVTASGVRINEVETGTAASASEEFVELFNAGTAPADIAEWKVVYRSAAGTSDTVLATIPTGTTLAPGGFFVLGGASYAGAQAADQSFSTGLAATGAAVGLRDDTGNLVDSVGWGSATNALVESAAAPSPPATAAPGSSIVRLPDGHDTNSNASDFTVSSTPTPHAANR